MRRHLPFAIIGGVLLIAIGSGLMLFQWKQPSSSPIAPVAPIVPIASAAPTVPSPSTAPTTPTVPVGPETPAKADLALPHIRGGANAPVTLEEFGDFQCIPCALFYPRLKQVEADYGDRLRVIFRHKPMVPHEHAIIAARAAEAAGLQGRFWEMHDLLFQNSARWTKGVDTVGEEAHPSRRLQSNVLALESEVRDVFISYATRLNLDVDRFQQDMDSDEVKARVAADAARGDALGIDRTPTIYINGHLVPPTRFSVSDLHATIDAGLSGKESERAPVDAQTARPEQPK